MKTRILLTGIAAILVIASPDLVNARQADSPESSPSVQAAVPTPPSFVHFRTHRFGRSGATANWSIDSPGGITGFVVQRTYEDPTDPYAVWDDVGAVPCGNIRNFRFNDTNVSPGYISYRVVMMNGATAVGMSDVSTILIAQH
jgi:hypothetical protein